MPRKLLIPWGAALAVVLITVFVVNVRLFRSPSHSLKDKVSDSAAVAQSSASHVIPSAPNCASVSGPASSSVTVKPNAAGNDFSTNCYFAVANQKLTIHFTNTVYTLTGHDPISMILMISPSQDPAISSVPGNPRMTIMNRSKAIFVSQPVMAPNTSVMIMPELRPGSYVMQIMQMPHFIATLVVR